MLPPRMITIVRGAYAMEAVRKEAAASAAVVLRSDGIPHTQIPWGGLRTFLAQASASLGDNRIERAIAPYASLLSLALRDIAISEADRRARGALSGLALGALPNPVVRTTAIYRAWQRAFGEILAGERVLIAVADLDAVDFESLRALRPIARALRDRADARIIIADPPAPPPPSPVDAFFRARRLEEVARIEALPVTIVVEAPDRLGAEDATVRAVRQTLDGGLEARAPDADGVREAFDAFAFEPAFRLAEAFLGRGGADDGDTRDALALGALALYNLAPSARESWINELLVNHFTRLVKDESDPLTRAHWHYRLALVHARGRGALGIARAAADASVAASEEGSADPRAPLFAAWARNGRAYVRARAHDLAGAAEDTEAGLAALERGAGDVPASDVHLTRLFIANNRARVAQMAGDEESLAVWRAIRTRHFDALAPDERPGLSWLPVPGGHRELAVQRDHLAMVLADARDRFDVDDEAIAAHGLGIVLYKLGDARGAHDAFATSLRIWSITGGFAEDLLTEELNTAVTAFRAGDSRRAADGFARVRSHPLMQNAAAQAETLAALAMIDARAGDRERAAGRAAEAIHSAETLGEVDVLVRTMRSAAEAHLAMDDRRESRQIIARARKAMDAAAGDGIDLPAEDMLGVYVTSLDASDDDEDDNSAALDCALALVPRVVDDANAWWDLPRLARHVFAGLRGGSREDLAAEGLTTLAMVVDQRLSVQ